MEHLNTFKICKPQGHEKFNYAMPIIYFNGKCHFVKPGSFIFGEIPTMIFKDVTINYVIDLYIDFTDYTLYNPAKDKHGNFVPISFHHLN